jgi:hypothetical protein
MLVPAIRPSADTPGLRRGAAASKHIPLPGETHQAARSGIDVSVTAPLVKMALDALFSGNPGQKRVAAGSRNTESKVIYFGRGIKRCDFIR